MASRRFPFPTPFGWFQVAFPPHLAPREVTALHHLKREAGLWAHTGGAVPLPTALLAAHLAPAGTVAGDELQCPFHGWRYDGAGECTNIPYSQRTNRKARLRTYPVVERNGFVLAWYHPHGEPPQWEIPVIDEIGDP